MSVLRKSSPSRCRARSMHFDTQHELAHSALAQQRSGDLIQASVLQGIQQHSSIARARASRVGGSTGHAEVWAPAELKGAVKHAVSGDQAYAASTSPVQAWIGPCPARFWCDLGHAGHDSADAGTAVPCCAEMSSPIQ